MKTNQTLNESLNNEERSMKTTRRSHEAFQIAWKKAGYPDHFLWSPKSGRIWTREAIRENIDFKSMSPQAQKAIIESRELKAKMRNLRG